MKMKLRKLMQQAASYIEIVLSAFLLMVIIFLAGEFIVESVMGIGYDNATLEYFLEKVMTFAIGVEFVKMLCTHTPGTVMRPFFTMMISSQSPFCATRALSALRSVLL